MFCRVVRGAVIYSVKAGARDYQKELNYQEALKESYVAYASPGLSPEIEHLLASAEVGCGLFGLKMSPHSSVFAGVYVVCSEPGGEHIRRSFPLDIEFDERVCLTAELTPSARCSSLSKAKADECPRQWIRHIYSTSSIRSPVFLPHGLPQTFNPNRSVKMDALVRVVRRISLITSSPIRSIL